MMGYGFGMGLAGWIFMGLFWIAIIGLAIWAAAALLPRTRPAERDGPETPEQILDRRFAQGELDVEQFRQAREQLAASTARRR